MSYKIDCLKCVKSDWYHKWCSLNNYRLYDYVKGPLKSPMVIVPISYEIKEKDEMDGCDCIQYLKECYSKPGIPDPWSEYLIFRRESDKGKDVSSDFPKCDLDITRYLDKHYRVYLGQGIPDPWKKWTHIEPLEPNFDDLRKNWRSYAENLRIGPGCDMYDVDKVCCPNCNRRLLVLCLKKSTQEEKEIGKDVANSDPVSKPTEEKLMEQKICLKDACVETDRLPDAKNDEVQISKTCSCKLRKICSCNNNCISCPVCNNLKNEARTEGCTCKKHDFCSCKKNSIKNGFFYNSGPNCPLRTKNIRQYIPITDQSDGPPLPKPDYGHQGSVSPFFCSSSDHCGCPAQQFIGFEEKNNHGLELQLICPKCEAKRKKRRKTKCGQRKENHFPCHCRNNEKDSFQKYTNEDEHECDICNCARKARHFNKQIKPNTTCNAEHRCRCCGQESNKTKIFEDMDYVRLLEILGCPRFFLNKLNMNCDKPKRTRNKIPAKGKRHSSGPNHSSSEDNISDINKEGFHDFERGWTNRNYKKYEVSRRSTGTKKEFETVHKDPKCTNKKKQIPSKIPYNSHHAVDELRKIRSRLRSQRNRNAFREELKYFLSNCSKDGFRNDSESSSQTGAGILNEEIKARHSSWQKDRNII